MNRRNFLAGLMAGGIVVAGDLWIPGKKLISIPKPIVPIGTFTGTNFIQEPNMVSLTVTGTVTGDHVYMCMMLIVENQY